METTRNRYRWFAIVLAAALLTAAAFTSVSVGNSATAASATPVVYIATGENFPDALGGGPPAALAKGPILLVQKDAIPPATASELTRLSPDKIVIVGGPGVVSANVENALKAFAPTVERIAGTNRYETAAKLSASVFPATINADTFDGKDSAAFVEHGDIVMAASGSNWKPHGGDGPLVRAFGGYSYVTGDGFVEIGLDAPAMISGVSYELMNVEVCYELLAGTYLEQTGVTGSDVAPADFLAFDGTDRFGTGCHTVAVAAPAPRGAAVRVRILDDGVGPPTANLFGVRAIWTPAD